MRQATFRFYAELNDFLPATRRQAGFSLAFRGRPSAKDLIESLGVPHTEVDLILVNGESRPFDHPLADGDRVAVFPQFESFDITLLLRLRPRPLREPRFVLDVHLGRLAAYLRLLGFDSLYRNDCDDATLAGLAASEGRILLTRDRQLPKRVLVTRAYCVRQTEPRRQLVEVLRRFDLGRSLKPFTRCLTCNGLLAPARADEVRDRVPAGVFERGEALLACTMCGKVYWQGSHVRRMRSLVAEALHALRNVRS